MRKQFTFIVSIIILPILILSCGSGKLSKEEAKKQIDERIVERLKVGTDQPVIHFDREFWVNDLDPNNKAERNGLEAVKQKGYIDLTQVDRMEPGYGGNLEKRRYLIMKVLEKGKPFFMGQEYKYYNFKTGTFISEIVSIAEPAPNAGGSIACNVECLYKFIPNEMYSTYIKGANFNNALIPDKKGEEQFIKTQDGWKLKSDR